jgi:hypothetical protein
LRARSGPFTKSWARKRAKLGIKKRDGGIDASREEILARSPVSTTTDGLNYYQLGGETAFLYEPHQYRYVRIHMPFTGPTYFQCRITGQQPAPI